MVSLSPLKSINSQEGCLISNSIKLSFEHVPVHLPWKFEHSEPRNDREKECKKKKKSYTEPPSYSYRGRGLVYNCKGKHWACVDKESYLKCRENEKWQKNKSKKTECKTINVYENVKDCNTIQLHNIHTLVKTDFCKS